jgi:Predicted glycosyltransferases
MGTQLSIITVNLNNKEGLLQTMHSVLNQTWQGFEYIIIDGGSADGSVDLIRDYENKLTCWVSEPDNGVYAAMNKGISYAKGEYLLFLNSGDTLLEADTLKNIIPLIFDEQVDLLYGDLRFDHGESYVDYVFPDDITFEFLCQRSLGHPSAFIKRVLFERIGNYEEHYRICADWVFFTSAICLHNCTYKHVPYVITSFDTHGISSQQKYQNQIKKERMHALTSKFRFLYEMHNELFLLKEKLASLQRSKPYRFLKLLGLPKYQ